jgi:hypothetical protein
MNVKPHVALILAALAWLCLSTPADAQWPPVPVFSTCISAAGRIFVCPAGDGPTLASRGLRISVGLFGAFLGPDVGEPAAGIWAAAPTACPANPLIADAPTDLFGKTTISGSLAAGGCGGAVSVFIWTSPPAIAGSPLPITVVSVDMTGDLFVNLADVGVFSAALNGAYNACADFNSDGFVNLADVGVFSAHIGHHC